MPQSFYSVHLHLVFSTKNRHPFLTDKDLRQEVHRYLAGISKTLGCDPIMIGGVSDHVHILARLGKQTATQTWVKEVKRVSSAWIKERDRRLSEFAWQSGYGMFAVDSKGVEPVRRYIEVQDEHHRKFSFQDEFRRLLHEEGIEFDERYIWD
ncbi:MAG: IS200/IS605 family transposase [Fimbriimonas sp.]|nr:IS200/IS605 family transposase [Fimbriimonas sp.]